jgi:small subunit ribosomal protein S16
VALKIRLRRIGAKKQPAYRIVVADARTKRDGRFVEILGHYNPLTDPATVVIKGDRALYWLRNGAQPTDVVRAMLVRQGIWSEFTGEAIPDYVLAARAQAAAAAPAAPVVVEAVPAPVEEAAVEETPAEEAPVAEEAPAEEVAPAVEEAAPADEAPAADETPAE